MIKESIQSLFNAMRALLGARSSLAIFAVLYVLLLGALYGFVAIREATVLQVILTLLFLALAPVLFFLLQAAIIDHAQTGRIERSRVLRDSTRLALVTIPVILTSLAIMWLLNRWQRHFPAPYFNPVAINPNTSQTLPTPPTHWPTVLFTTMRVFVFGVALPLTLIQFWVAAAGNDLAAFFRGGWRAFLRRLAEILGRAFSPVSVLIYALGLIVFAVIPYVLLFVRIPMNGVKREIAIFTVRLVFVFAFILVGWVVTLSAFAKRRGNPEAAVPAAVGDEPSPNQTTEQVELSAV